MRILQMMRKNRTGWTLICAIMVMMLATGCGKEKEAPIPVDLSSENGQDGEENTEENTGADDEIAGNSQTQRDDKLEGDDTQAGQVSGTEELDCNVKSIGQDSFIVCRNTTYSDGDTDIVVGPAPGYEEADDLVTVYVNENCSYQYKTVRNGGVNPEDVSSREGSFGDLKNGMLCTVRGSWRDGYFYADSIVMSEFV